MQLNADDKEGYIISIWCCCDRSYHFREGINSNADCSSRWTRVVIGIGLSMSKAFSCLRESTGSVENAIETGEVVK